MSYSQKYNNFIEELATILDEDRLAVGKTVAMFNIKKYLQRHKGQDFVDFCKVLDYGYIYTGEGLLRDHITNDFNIFEYGHQLFNTLDKVFNTSKYKFTLVEFLYSDQAIRTFLKS